MRACAFRDSIRVLLVALALVSCSDSPAPRASSLLLITLDTTRYDALTYLGAPPGVTPHLDAFATESISYEMARTVAPITLPAPITAPPPRIVAPA